jgi:hypothetical protein
MYFRIKRFFLNISKKYIQKKQVFKHISKIKHNEIDITRQPNVHKKSRNRIRKMTKHLLLSKGLFRDCIYFSVQLLYPKSIVDN